MKAFVLLSTTAALADLSAAALASGSPQPEFFLIRHAEKNPDGTISAQGKQREQCLVKLFGKGSKYNIQHIMTQNPYPGDPESQRPYNTTVPLAQNLGLTIEHYCDYDDVDCAAKAAFSHYADASGNVLIAWEHYYMRRIAAAMTNQDVNNVHSTPNDKFDLIFEIPAPYKTVDVAHENCPGIDN